MNNEEMLIEKSKHNELSQGKQNAEDVIIEKSFDHIFNNTHNINNIYVYMGQRGFFGVYKNIESTNEVYVEVNSDLFFLENNKVLYPTSCDPEIFFQLIREEYLKYLSEFFQEKAAKNVLKLGKKPLTER